MSERAVHLDVRTHTRVDKFHLSTFFYWMDLWDRPNQAVYPNHVFARLYPEVDYY